MDAGLEQELRRAARARGSLWRLTAWRVAFGIAVVVAWQLASGTLLEPRDVSSPIAVTQRLLRLVESGALAHHTWVTLRETLYAFVIGSVGGVVFGIVLGVHQRIGDIVSPYLIGLNALPKLALAPLFIVWFGIGIEMKVAMGASLVFFLVFLSAHAGVREVDDVHVNSLRLLGASPWQILYKLTLPSAMVSIILGLKLAVPYALIGAVVGEMIAASEGLGFLITTASAQYDTGGVFACLVVLGGLALVINQIVEWLERYTLRWKSRSV